MITEIILFGAIALGIAGAHKDGVSGVGAVKRAKRRIFVEMGKLQENGFNLEDKFEDLRPEQVRILSDMIQQFNFKASKRSAKSPEEQFYNSIRRMYNAISGIGATTLPAKNAVVIRNGRGDQIMQYVDYGSEQDIFNNAMNWFYDEFVAPGLDGFKAAIYYIADGGKFLWDGGKTGKRGVKNEVFATSTNASAERKQRISYLSKNGISIDAFVDTVHPQDGRSLDEHYGDYSEIRDGVIAALREFISVGDCQKYIADMYLNAHYIPDDQEEYTAPF